MNCYPCEKTIGKKVKKDEVMIKGDEPGEMLMIYVCPECGDISD